jgi:hypothetical protein
MLRSIGSFFGKNSQQKSVVHPPAHKPNSHHGSHHGSHQNGHHSAHGAGRAVAATDRKPTYSKVFRWKLPEGVSEAPLSVEVVGSFTDWQRVPLLLDHKVGSWHATIQNIPGNKTHHYMMLVDGKPTQDKGCDGYALPDGAAEERYAIETPRGPRVFMLFAQTK